MCLIGGTVVLVVNIFINLSSVLMLLGFGCAFFFLFFLPTSEGGWVRSVEKLLVSAAGNSRI